MGIDIPKEHIAAYCRRWRISELALFGSVLRNDFRPDSDVDVLVSFAPDANWGLWDLLTMEEELAAMLGRKVDLLTREGVQHSRNWLRKGEILRTAEIIYAA